MKTKFVDRSCLIVLLILLLMSHLHAKNESTVTHQNKTLQYAVAQLATVIAPSNILTAVDDNNILNSTIIVLTIDDIKNDKRFTSLQQESIKSGGYWIRHLDKQLLIIGANKAGAIYGSLDVKEQLQAGINAADIPDKKVEPRFEFRAIKFNLPYMAYRSNYCLTQQDMVVRDLKFWEAFLDMMEQNRFNVLSLWSLHPFHYMVKPANFPEACGYNDEEMLSWKNFWTSLFAMAHERGIETYIINWNSFVPPSFANAHHVATYSAKPSHFGAGDTSAIIEKYTREVIKQVINEYPDLDGLGITLGERMGGQSPDERRAWLDRTIFAGMKDANRKIKFVYRAPLSANEGSGGSTSEENDEKTRAQIESLDINNPAYVEFKYNWSHGHSSPKLFIVHGGKLTEKYKDPLPEKYKYVWTVRNEDFYVLRWGQPDFVREFIQNNGHNYVGGCFLGSEVFIPAMDFTSKEGTFKDWQYHFQRQWLWYAVWGRLLYNPTTPDAVFENMLAAKYGATQGKTALSAWKHASNNQLRFAAFHQGRADGTLYTEGFCRWGDNRPASLFDINDIITHPVLDTTRYISVLDYVTGARPMEPGMLTPFQFAKEYDDNNALLWEEIKKLKTSNPVPQVAVEINDLEAWYWYGKYFADKLRAAVHVANYRYKGIDERRNAVSYLEQCKTWWKNYTNALAKYNKESIPFHTDKDFSWKAFQLDVEKDIQLAQQEKK